MSTADKMMPGTAAVAEILRRSHAELLRREAAGQAAIWRDGYIAGKRQHVLELLESSALSDMALEIKLLRVIVSVLSENVGRLEDEVAWHRDRAECYFDAYHALRQAI